MLTGWHYLPEGEDDPFAPMGASTFLDLAPTQGLRSPERLCRLYVKGRPDPGVFGATAMHWHAQGCRVQCLNEPNLPSEGFGGGPADYGHWFMQVRVAAPTARLYYAGMSPGVEGWRDWYVDDYVFHADGIAAHAYGTFDQMREVVEELRRHDKPIWLAEVNFGAGNVVVPSEWADQHLRPFLDWCATVPLVEAVTYFAYEWKHPDMAMPVPVDGKGTRIETVLRSWRPPDPPPAPEVRPMHKRAYLWQFDQLGEQSVAEIAATLRLGGIAEVACKTHQGLTWLGRATDGDKSPLAFRSTADVHARFLAFQAEGIRMVPWCVPSGADTGTEAALAADVARACDGVIELDLEPYPGFWEGAYDGLTPYTQAIGDRGARYEVNFDARVGGWRPFGAAPFALACARADAVWTQSYWTDFQRDAEAVVADALATLALLEVPPEKAGVIYPWDGPADYDRVTRRIQERMPLVTRIGMWRMGTAGPAVYTALAAIPTTTPTPAPGPEPAPVFDVEAVRGRLWTIKDELSTNGWSRFAQAIEAAVTQSKGEP